MSKPSSDKVKLVILGAGGHGQVMLDVVLRQTEAGHGLQTEAPPSLKLPPSASLRRTSRRARGQGLQGEADVIGFLDDRPKLWGQQVAGIEVLGGTVDSALLDRVGATHFLVGIGDNRTRADKYLQMQELGLLPWSAIHPSTILADSASLGDGAQVVGGVVVNPEAQIGEDVILNTACTVDHHCVIGDHAFVGPGAHLGGEVRVGSFALLGIGVVVLPGLTIGEAALVGAGAVVTKYVPQGVVVAGVPARVVRQIQP
jgi:acetyltransferase EpsM